MLQQQRHLGALAIQQQTVAIRYDKKVSEPLSLRGQQCGPHRVPRNRLRYVIRYKTLQEGYAILAADLDNAPLRQRCQSCHGERVGFGAADRKKC